MRKTLLAAFISASVFALPAFAQVSLGGAGRIGAGVAPGAGALNGPMHSAGQLDSRLGQSQDRLDQRTRRTAHDATDRTRSAVDRHGSADVDADARGSARADAGDTHAHANAGANARTNVDAGAAMDQANGTARGIGDQVSGTAHSAIRSGDRTAGSVGDAVRQTATESSVGADTKVRAKADAHGH